MVYQLTLLLTNVTRSCDGPFRDKDVIPTPPITMVSPSPDTAITTESPVVFITWYVTPEYNGSVTFGNVMVAVAVTFMI